MTMTNADLDSNALPAQALAEPEVSMLDKLGITLDELCGAISQLDARLRAQDTPPERTPVPLTPTKPFFASTSGRNALSLTIRNPGNVSVFVSIDGRSPTRAAGALEIPAGALVTTPTPARDIQIAIDPQDIGDVAGGGFSVDVYRWWTVQPAAQFFSDRDTTGTTTYEYDGSGNVSRATYPDGSVETNTYDGSGNLLTRTVTR